MMCHIYCAVSLLTLTVAVAVAAPQSSVTVEPTAFDDVIYDQRQNGTENVRINLSDLKVVLAPADGLFQIMSMAGAQFLAADLPTETGSSTDECTGFKCTNRHRQTAKKNRFKLSSIIAPLLNNQSERKTGETESNNNSNNST